MAAMTISSNVLFLRIKRATALQNPILKSLFTGHQILAAKVLNRSGLIRRKGQGSLEWLKLCVKGKFHRDIISKFRKVIEPVTVGTAQSETKDKLV